MSLIKKENPAQQPPLLGVIFHNCNLLWLARPFLQVEWEQARKKKDLSLASELAFRLADISARKRKTIEAEKWLERGDADFQDDPKSRSAAALSRLCIYAFCAVARKDWDEAIQIFNDGYNRLKNSTTPMDKELVHWCRHLVNCHRQKKNLQSERYFLVEMIVLSEKLKTNERFLRLFREQLQELDDQILFQNEAADLDEDIEKFPQAPLPEGSLITIFTAASSKDASLMQSILEAQGCHVYVGEKHILALNMLLAPAIGGARVMVPESQVSYAREILNRPLKNI